MRKKRGQHKDMLDVRVTVDTPFSSLEVLGKFVSFAPHSLSMAGKFTSLPRRNAVNCPQSYRLPSFPSLFALGQRR
jgi:hypothetical protein